mgnify:CR=1 FL=1
MKEQAIETLQHAASTKTALLVGVSGATANSWIDWLVYSEEARAVGILLGALVSISIVVVNITSIKYRRASALEEVETIKQERMLNEKRSILLDEQLKNITNPD